MSAHPYANYTQFTQVYSVSGLTQAQLENHYLPAAARYVDGRLSPAFTAPFSSNNLTARDLNIHAAYYLFVRGRTSKQTDSDEIKALLDDWITALVSSGGSMALSDDTVLNPSAGTVIAWSNVMNYAPVFNMLDPDEQRVDPDRQNDEAD